MIFCNTLIFKERNLKNLAKENKETEQKSIVLRKEDSIKNVACWPLRLIFCICFTKEPQKNKQREFTTKFSYPCHLLCKVFLKESYVSVFGLDYLLCFVLFSSHMAVQWKYPLNSTGRLSLYVYLWVLLKNQVSRPGRLTVYHPSLLHKVVSGKWYVVSGKW